MVASSLKLPGTSPLAKKKNTLYWRQRVAAVGHHALLRNTRIVAFAPNIVVIGQNHVVASLYSSQRHPRSDSMSYFHASDDTIMYRDPIFSPCDRLAKCTSFHRRSPVTLSMPSHVRTLYLRLLLSRRALSASSLPVSSLSPNRLFSFPPCIVAISPICRSRFIENSCSAGVMV